MDRRGHIIVAAFFLAVIMAPGIFQTVSELRSGERPGALDVFSQAPTARNLHDYERSLEQTSLVVKQLRPWAQYLQWSLLRDAGEKIIVGRQGWLFYQPSVRYAVGREASAPTGDSADPVAAIRSFRDQLAARRIRLLVIPVPDKESVYPEMLASRADGAGVVVGERTRRLFEQLKHAGVEHADLFDLFRRAKDDKSQSDRGRLYLAQDSHWSPEGVRLAASAVARQVLDRGTVKRGEHAYALRPVDVVRHGDLVEMMRAPPLERAIAPESLACLQVLESSSQTPYRDRLESEILILGDSFVRIYQRDEPGAAGFIAHLARELGQPLCSIVNDGGASTLVRQELARRPALLANKTLVIWEFAERDIRFGTEGWAIIHMTSTRNRIN
jgi:hypothetical protein